MGLLDWLVGARGLTDVAPDADKRAPLPLVPIATEAPYRAVSTGEGIAAARSLAGGRVTVDRPGYAYSGAWALMAPDDFESRWRSWKLDHKTLDRVDPIDLLDMLIDLSPSVSRANSDYLRFCNPGYEITVLKPGTDDVDPVGQRAADDFRQQLDEHHGSFDVVINRLFMMIPTRGCLFGELVLDENGRVPIDIATPDPRWVRFRHKTIPPRGDVYVPGQWQNGVFVEFDRPTVKYLPFDPFPGSPYGRPWYAAALFTTLFELGLLHDLRRVVSQQGYPRLDFEIDSAKLKALMPDDVRNDATKAKQWHEAIVDQIRTSIASLEPEDAYVHSDVVKVNRPVGAVDSSSLGGIEGMNRILGANATAALKAMPLTLGRGYQTGSETQANRQWEVHAAGIKAIQHLNETLLGGFFGLALRVQGFRAEVRLRFAELRAAEMLRDEQTRALRNQNALFEYLMGWESHEAAALNAVGHEPDAAEPRALPGNFAAAGDAATAQASEASPDPTGDRGNVVQLAQAVVRLAAAERARRALMTPGGSADPLPSLPESAGITAAQLAEALAEWDGTMPDEYDGLLDAEVV